MQTKNKKLQRLKRIQSHLLISKCCHFSYFVTYHDRFLWYQKKIWPTLYNSKRRPPLHGLTHTTTTRTRTLQKQSLYNVHETSNTKHVKPESDVRTYKSDENSTERTEASRKDFRWPPPGTRKSLEREPAGSPASSSREEGQRREI